MEERPPQNGQRLDGWTIVFDLDGTLVNTAPDLIGALNAVVGPMGVPTIHLADVDTLIGRGAKAMIEAALLRAPHIEAEPDMDRLFEAFVAHYRANIAVRSHLYEGVVPALQALSDLGAKLCVCTNKTQALSEQLLGEMGLAQHFQAVIGADSVAQRKPDAGHVRAAISAAGGQVSKSVFVGDSRTDESAARNAGLPFIFVPFGYEAAPADEIKKAGVLHNYSGLLGLVVSVLS
ncbi:MAG: HAD-IA family hydrolase [Pseudomonadota bacterium]